MSNTNDNKIYELGMKYSTDKIYHHEYHEIYSMFLQRFYESSGAILEIGIKDDNSLNMWLELFPNAYIYGMDINKSSYGEKYQIVKGDQSNQNDLNNLNALISQKELFFINDDGSHIPEHQLLSFNTLFPSLVEGGI